MTKQDWKKAVLLARENTESESFMVTALSSMNPESFPSGRHKDLAFMAAQRLLDVHKLTGQQ